MCILCFVLDTEEPIGMVVAGKLWFIKDAMEQVPLIIVLTDSVTPGTIAC